jgi:hypothetical protein
MKRKRHFTAALIISSVIISMLLISFQDKKTNVTGTWNIALESTIGSGNPVFVLKQDNDSIITGTYSGYFGELPVKGKILSNKIRIEIVISQGTIVYSGTVEGNAMTGKVDFGSYGDGTFTGKKKTE